METLTDGERIYQNICTNPQDDNARLVYADWLDDNFGSDEEIREVCCVCKGISQKDTINSRGFYETKPNRCALCLGNGHVSYIARERAEYIRLAIKLLHPPTREDFVGFAQWQLDDVRRKELLRKYKTIWCNSPLLWQKNGYPRNVTLMKGFPFCVSCSIDELATDWNSIKIPSRWVTDCVQKLPIEWFQITYHQPVQLANREWWVWRDSRHAMIGDMFASGPHRSRVAIERSSLPYWLFRLVQAKSEGTDTRFAMFKTQQSAQSILAESIGEWARECVANTNKELSVYG